VITREKLPNIGEHVEILSDDLPSARQKPAEPREPAREPPAPPPVALAIEPDPQPRGPAARAERPTYDSQEAARRLFEVKEIDYNPRRPFYLTLIALGLVGLGYGGYVWWQLQPKYTYNAQTLREAKDKPAPLEKAPVITATA